MDPTPEWHLALSAEDLDQWAVGQHRKACSMHAELRHGALYVRIDLTGGPLPSDGFAAADVHLPVHAASSLSVWLGPDHQDVGEVAAAPSATTGQGSDYVSDEFLF
ncbi:Rfesd [Symbiodinium natans]|uniref:Rfesd protein n=1 Tax=Symbiodinium natans TaxID=878477 RepID=A0A812LJW7_9DINO|nr:Rfesd [Symbiodinium natans]